MLVVNAKTDPQGWTSVQLVQRYHTKKLTIILERNKYTSTRALYMQAVAQQHKHNYDFTQAVIALLHSTTYTNIIVTSPIVIILTH